ncbi:MAG: DEAD/DEAH box helicase [Planctomycetota bacterium]|jgi:superfamily II DNA/RNA helicase
MSIKSTPSDERDRIASDYFEQLLYPPYPVQEESLLAWFTSDHGVLVCAPTGTGKTLIAEGAVYEALRTGQRCYYTTPLIALTDQKLQELQSTVVRWGYPMSSVGLVTGNRRVNPDAPVLVVVAEILLNRLLQIDADPMDDVASVIMDEFHSFNDPERGIVWELSIGMLPQHVRLMLLSATIGNSVEFCSWMLRAHGRKVELVQSTDRKVPLQFEWVDDSYLDEHLERIAEGDEIRRRTPGLVFCFNRDQCWQVADLLKGKKLIDKNRQSIISKRLESFDLSQGAGPKLKQILIRGVGIHHAGILPKYRRIVEQLFQEKLLSICVCTETLSAGINLPARSVILPRLVKGPYGKQKVIEPSTAQQIFGRAGRPQFDREGFVYAMAHEDDVKYNRWKLQYDQIPEDTRDPNLIKAKKQLKKKMPTRRAGETYWSKEQFEKLRIAPSAKLASRGHLPWRLLAHMLRLNPEVQPLRDLVGKRLLPPLEIAKAQIELNRMLVTLWTAGFLDLDPKPQPKSNASASPTPRNAPPQPRGWLALPSSATASAQDAEPAEDEEEQESGSATDEAAERGYELENYRPDRIVPRPRLELLSEIRSVNPIYGLFLIGHLQFANDCEKIQALESVLELPANIAKTVRVPPPDQLPFGPLATEILHPKLLELGLAGVEEITGVRDEDEEDSESGGSHRPFQPPPRPLALGEKLRRLFDYDFPGVHDVYTRSVWVVSELLQFEGDFNKYILAHGLQKQEGMLFRHVLRFILLLNEISGIAPENTTPEEWELPLDAIGEQLIAACRRVDPESTDEVLQELNDTNAPHPRRRS